MGQPTTSRPVVAGSEAATVVPVATARAGLRWAAITLLVVALGVGLWGSHAASLRRDPAAR